MIPMQEAGTVADDDIKRMLQSIQADLAALNDKIDALGQEHADFKDQLEATGRELSESLQEDTDGIVRRLGRVEQKLDDLRADLRAHTTDDVRHVA
jgi:septal ring factor EnvC (AmiA/AmiB activator)